LGLALLVVAGCRDDGSEPVTIELSHMRPRNAQGVYLNEAVELYFSAEIDRASVTSRSFQVVSADGTPARGERTVTGREIRFVPAPVLTPSLMDGGYQPGTTYNVALSGFPRLDCIRGLDGEPLSTSYEMPFETVSLASEGAFFDDLSPERSDRSLLTDSMQIGPDFPIVITCNEPCDPRTLFADDWTLTQGNYQVPLEARIVQNWEEGSRELEPSCRIELIPLETLLPGYYNLRVEADLRLRDFGGNPVARMLRPGEVPAAQLLYVRAGYRLQGKADLYLPFLDSGLANLVALPNVDGLAHWAGTGKVGVRFPAAAGNGDEGAVLLGEREARSDVQSTRLTLPEGTTCTLEPSGGMVVLRSQGRMEFSGDLLRRSGGEAGESTPHEDELFPVGQDLSDWLAEALAQDKEWTVLISGGDVIIHGDIDVDTPLLIIAGGMIRAFGDVQSRPNQLWMMGTGGSSQLDREGSRIGNLVMDAPLTNPLKEPLTYAVLSAPVPPHWVKGASRLRSNAGGYAGLGSWSVRFLPEEPPFLPENAVAYPQLRGGPVRLLIELEVLPGPSWDPPYVDYVHLTWEQK
jgi:hypothetical protein